jgi:hypothetical protein
MTAPIQTDPRACPEWCTYGDCNQVYEDGERHHFGHYRRVLLPGGPEHELTGGTTAQDDIRVSVAWYDGEDPSIDIEHFENVVGTHLSPTVVRDIAVMLLEAADDCERAFLGVLPTADLYAEMERRGMDRAAVDAAVTEMRR